jgi:hypothetical protein
MLSLNRLDLPPSNKSAEVLHDPTEAADPILDPRSRLG